jgi:hypothetical protein
MILKAVKASRTTKSGYPIGYPLALRAGVLPIYLMSNQRRSNYLYLVVFKPDWLLHLNSFQIYEVKAKRLFNFSSNSINSAYCSSESPEWAVTGYPYQTAL